MALSAAYIALTEFAASVMVRIRGINILVKVKVIVKIIVSINTVKTIIEPFCISH